MADLLARLDRGVPLLAASKNAKVFEGRVARVHSDGDPLIYPQGPEFRTREELARIVAQLPGKLITMLHPAKDEVSTAPHEQVVGRILEARLDGDYAVVKAVVEGDAAIADVHSGIRELSLGYKCRLDAKRYQYDTNVDHLALVPAARCGDTCALRVDTTHTTIHETGVAMTAPPSDVSSETPLKCPCQGGPLCAECMHRANLNTLGHGDSAGTPCKSCAMRYHAPITSMPDAETIKMDELQKQLTAAIADAVALKARVDAADQLASTAETKLAAAEVVRDNAVADSAAEKTRSAAALAAEVTRADAAIETARAEAAQVRADAAANQQAAVAARVALETMANAILGSTDTEGKIIDRSKIIDRDLKVAVIKHVDGIDVAADKVSIYVDGIFDGAVERHARAKGSTAGALQALTTMRVDGANVLPATLDDEKAAQAALARNLSTAWMKTQE